MSTRPDKNQVHAGTSAGARLDDGEPATIALTGRLDALRALLLRSELDELVACAASEARGVLVDLSAVVFVDSAALAALVRLRRQCIDAGLDLALVKPRHADALRIFRLTQFDEVFVMLERRPR
jgi:anti-sigma B factor antagonist